VEGQTQAIETQADRSPGPHDDDDGPAAETLKRAGSERNAAETDGPSAGWDWVDGQTFDVRDDPA